MENQLIIIGEELLLNKPYMEYVDEQLTLHVGFFDSRVILRRNDSDFFIKLEDLVSKSQQNIILVQKDSFTFVNKIISTMSEDRLELIDDMLIPSKSILYSKDSFVISKDEKIINVISLKENEELPNILIENSKSVKNFTVVDIDLDSLKLLIEPICSTYEIKIKATSIVEGLIKINATASKYGDLENFLKSISTLFSGKFIDNDDVVEHITEKLKQNNKKITSVESCTGGLISSMITKIPGSSNVFDGGIVSYANEIKESWLGVSKDTLEKLGAVSEQCVREMLDGILTASRADFALATSGIAGPSGGSENKPVGTVFVGVKSINQKAKVYRLHLKGDRHYIQTQSAYFAFKLLLELDKKLFF